MDFKLDGFHRLILSSDFKMDGLIPFGMANRLSLNEKQSTAKRQKPNVRLTLKCEQKVDPKS